MTLAQGFKNLLLSLMLPAQGWAMGEYSDARGTVNPNTNASGGGTSDSPSAGESDAPGILTHFTGTTSATAGRQTIYGTSADPETILLGGARYLTTHRVRVPALSTGSEQFTVLYGFWAGSAIQIGNNSGVYFRYTEAENAGNWTCVCSNSGTATTADSGVPVVAGDWFKLEIDISADGSQAIFLINGAIVATITTNLPTVGVRFLCQRIKKSVGTGDRTTQIDTHALRYEMATPR